MKKFIIHIFLFLFFVVVTGEIVVRLTHAVSDVPQRTIDKYGIQKYLPNQEGYWKGGDHKWMVNKSGWPGELPESYNNLILVLGDSFIENFMNPNNCHQSSFLEKNMTDYNFMEASRSGVSLIEAMEIRKQMDSLNPLHSLIYVNDEDFYESVSEIKPMGDITQYSITSSSIKFGEMKASFQKKILYSFKLLYYFYNRFPINNQSSSEEKPKSSESDAVPYYVEISQLIDYIKNNYDIRNKTLVFHPNSSTAIIEICRNAGFNIILLDSSNDKTWTFDYDKHWTCYGHERAAQQVSQQLKTEMAKNRSY